MPKPDDITTPIHPGEILLEDFLKPMGVSAYRLAHDIHVPQTRISKIIHRQRAVTADTALRLARYFGTDPAFWLNIQKRYDLEITQHQLKDELQNIRKLAS